jgi:hypothetical protein
MKNKLLRRAAAIMLTAISLFTAGCAAIPQNSGAATNATESVSGTKTQTQTQADDTAAKDDNNMTTVSQQIKRGMGVTCDDLVQTGDRSQRWLSMPDSRLVLNPYDFDANNPDTTHPQASDSAELPLNIGYLDPYINNSRGRGFYNSALLLEDTGNTDAKIASLWSANFGDAIKWSRSGGDKTSVEISGGKLSITVKTGAPEAWQYASQTLRLDEVTSDTVISITVDSCEGSWALKLNDGKSDDIKIQGDTNKTGTVTFNLSDYLTVGKPFRGVVKLFSIGYDKKLTVSALEVSEVTPRYFGAESYTVSWSPQATSGTATYKNGLALEYKDFFIDGNTVARVITVTSDGTLAVGGALYGSVIGKDDATLTIKGDRYAYICAVSDINADLSFFADTTAMYAGQTGDPDSASAYIYNFGKVKTGDKFIFTFAIGSDAVSPNELISAARNAASDIVTATALAEREAYWNNYLTTIPTADDFNFKYVDSMGVTAAQLKQLYCIAWVFAAQSLLPENPELGFDYKQVCCGKPSMWGYGEARASYSASWESFFGMQMLAYTLPDEAWSAFTGLMSLVDEYGMLGGESLPSEKAHTAWVLYELTGDTAKLEAVYDDIARYLNWRVENPRWIYLDHNDVNSADADFAESALIDLKYMMKIAAAVKPGEVSSWQKKYDTLLAEYKKWFFDDAGKTYQYCDKYSFTRAVGNTIWVTKGLYVSELTDKYETMLMARFNSEFDKSASFCGFLALKYPDSSHTIYGLLNRGYDELAGELIEACARDVARVGMFAENYTSDAMPTPTGVRPSMFGCAMLVDSMLLKSGISYNFRLEE